MVFSQIHCTIKRLSTKAGEKSSSEETDGSGIAPSWAPNQTQTQAVSIVLLGNRLMHVHAHTHARTNAHTRTDTLSFSLSLSWPEVLPEYHIL